MPLVKNPELLTITTVKSKYVEQIPRCDDCQANALDDTCEMIGQSAKTGFILVRKDGRFLKCGWTTYFEWLTNKGMNREDAQAECRMLPRLFED